MIIYEDNKWTIRAVAGKGMLFFYVDDPRGGDDGSLDEAIDWQSIADKHSPLILLGDYSGVPTAWKDKKVFKTSCSLLDPNAIAFFHPVMIDLEPKHISECQYFAGFRGTTTTHSCRENLRTILGQLENSYFLQKDLFWSYKEEEQSDLHFDYLKLLDDTRFPVCPRGKGLNSIRFFESLRLGRIPILMADETKLPMEHLIDYSDFIIRVPESTDSIKFYIDEWVSSHDIEEASAKARDISLKHFSDPEKFIKEHLA